MCNHLCVLVSFARGGAIARWPSLERRYDEYYTFMYAQSKPGKELLTVLDNEQLMYAMHLLHG